MTQPGPSKPSYEELVKQTEAQKRMLDEQGAELAAKNKKLFKKQWNPHIVSEGQIGVEWSISFH